MVFVKLHPPFRIPLPFLVSVLVLFVALLSTSVPAYAARQCETTSLSGIGYGRTRASAEKVTKRAWRENAKVTFEDNYALQDGKYIRNLRCYANSRSARVTISRRAVNPLIRGRKTEKWICDVIAKPCKGIDEPANEPDKKVWKHAQQRLERRGFDYVEVKTVTACKNQSLYELKVIRGPGMFRSKKRIGECPYGSLSLEEVKEELTRHGFSYITMRRTNNGFSGKACKNDRYYKLTSDRWVEKTKKTVIGECPHGGLSIRKVERMLDNEGYSEIKFIDDTPPNYRVRACRDGDSYVMRIDRNGTIRGAYTDKRCGKGGYGFTRLRSILQNNGLTDIEFTHKKLPVYVVEACDERVRLSLRINRWGRIQKEKRIGRCDHQGHRIGQGPIWARSAAILKKSGYRKIRYKGSSAGKTDHYFHACKGPKLYNIILRSNKIISLKRKGGLAFLQCVADKF